MGPALSSIARGNEHAVQRGMERHVLTLLHRARNPRALAAAPLMDAVCRAMGTQDPVAALERVVLAVFAGDDEYATNLKNAILAVDFERAATNAELARQNGLSPRHFARRRAEAIAAIARYTRRIVEVAPVEPQARGSYEPAWRFESERAAFLDARGRDGVLEMRAIAGNLMRLADTRAARHFAREARADANLRLGRTDEARDLFATLPSHARLRGAAKLALLAGEFEAAERNALAALPACSEENERYRLFALISQSRLGRSLPWSHPPQTTQLPFCSWERTAMEVERARHLAREQRWSEAERCARAAHGRAKLLGYEELTARSAAVVHSAAKARGDAAQALSWRAHAIRSLLVTQDRLLATGLFTPYAPGCEIDAALCAALYERLGVVCAQMQGETVLQRAAVCEFVATLLAETLVLDAQAGRLDAAARAVARCDSALAHYARPLRSSIADMLALVVVALTGSSWKEVAWRLDDALARALPLLVPVAPRTIAIKLSRSDESRSGFADHLRNDDERPTATRDSIEAISDLRVRSVPFRSAARAALA